MIDFDFIEQLEGNVCEGYVPNPQGSNSGVTIACGFDLGQRDESELNKLFSKELAEKLSPYAGLKKQNAQQVLAQKPLIITKKQSNEINIQCKADAQGRLKTQWNNANTRFDFSDLSSACQTVIASVAFQYGRLESRTPQFWKQVTSENWLGAISNLREFGDAYPTRRNQEADLLENWLNAQQS